METFKLFSNEHFILIISNILFFTFLLFIANFFSKRYFAKISAITIFILKLAELTYRHLYNNEEIFQLLPLHLCNITLIFVIIMMLSGSKTLFQLCFYWSLGAIFAIATPDVKYSFPNFMTLSFFTTHFYILFAVVYAYIFFKFRPTLWGYFTAFFVINLICLGVYFLNDSLGTNYLYVNRVPDFSSPINYFGEWPYYIVVVELIYIILTYLIYFPFKSRAVKFGKSKFY
ncbi:TMEM164-related integral membrane acyltransferase [Fusobacterium mortiferum]|uniref:TMEM164-related integral membrane acyltransferase n=1 Tax=Fusobacterium mortiferum TaxID=850 RepID=UPI001F47AAF2|nr:TIGR02206 family membrane protein [Fusobacterium mortiferum]MCF2699916.1 TIGR02206 family membrane protein [Fusobacterium mortiferum]